MLDQTRGSDYTIWCVAALLYVCDAARLLARRELLLVEAGPRRLSAIFSRDPFTLAGRVLAFAPLLRPDRTVFVAPWGQEWTAATGLDTVIQALEGLRSSLGAARALAWAGFLLLFVAGPALTLALGPNAAVVWTAAMLYPAIGAAVGCLWWRRRRFGLTVAQSVLVSAEILVCPAFLPNLVRKITAAHPMTVDGGQVLGATAAADAKEEIFARLAARAEELIETASLESSEGERLQRYLVTLRGQP